MVRISHVDCHTFHCDEMDFVGFGAGFDHDTNIVDPVITAIQESSLTEDPLLTYADIGGIIPTSTELSTHIGDHTAHPLFIRVNLAVTKSNEVPYTPTLEGVLTKKDGIVTFNFLSLPIDSVDEEANFTLSTVAIPADYRPLANTICHGVLIENDDIDAFGIKINISTAGVITINGHALILDNWVFTPLETLTLMSGSISWKCNPSAP